MCCAQLICFNSWLLITHISTHFFYAGMWYGYLAYNEELFKEMKSKKAAETAAAAKGAKKRK